MSRIIIFLLLILYSWSAYGQQDSIKSYLVVGLSPISYKGDLSGSYRQWGRLVNIGLKLNKKQRLNSNFNLFYGSITVSNPFTDRVGPAPNSFVKTSFFGLEYNLQINLLKTRFVNFYISPGLGLLRFNPKDEDGNPLPENLKTRSSGEQYNTLSLMLPLNAGISFFLSQGVGIGLQAGWGNLNTDYFDNVGLLGYQEKNDNLLIYKLSVFIPLEKSVR